MAGWYCEWGSGRVGRKDGGIRVIIVSGRGECEAGPLAVGEAERSLFQAVKENWNAVTLLNQTAFRPRVPDAG
jgi:hypothetical protein